jgi:hypothetical protein
MPIEEREDTLARLLTHSRGGIAFNQHYADDGATIFGTQR